ncbi:putative DNA modification/repair radical SAM protein [uncultured Roseburia sp.]|uniref:DNA modification/repair radical SAM protein n=1 Tax=Brotonthovivens ammoniilytica TaxID=2981725 RepID=A0ABT2TG00_9FIRM|nr:putative DNA modification/repair radical SAM protein [Brotonthovivens ammoniilytica]MCU6761123.1 putative DNA modification/repair radical SAM protein [Brotonthovivens ammoniilytica]SCI19567.1 putative DNA modification/repair radical SAM protein [uncultured Roseburia sp.]
MNLSVKTQTLKEKLNILADAAKYDVACTSSGTNRRGKKGHIGNSVTAGICHSFASDGRCISLLKILFSNDCIYDCKYCQSRSSNSVVRATFLPEEICSLVIEFYKRNYIEGLFLSSAVVKSPAYTMEQIFYTIHLLRTRYCFNGYIHIKAIPNAPAELTEQLGYLADRMSINLELPTAGQLKKLAPHKTRSSILLPMRQIQNRICGHRLAAGKSPKLERRGSSSFLPDNIFDSKTSGLLANDIGGAALPDILHPEKPFVPAGQSTQMIIGASQETDFEILSITQALYQQFDLKRVFFSAYIPLNEDDALPPLDTPVPLLREHRLYQADWLLRFYGFHAEELLSAKNPHFNPYLDPKCHWALRHLEKFPIEIHTASYSELLRVPGIGNKSAYRIVKARREGPLTFDTLKKTGVVLKRAQYFITCNGKMLYPIRLEENFLTRQLTGASQQENWQITQQNSWRQLSLFEDMNLS